MDQNLDFVGLKSYKLGKKIKFQQSNTKATIIFLNNSCILNNYYIFKYFLFSNQEKQYQNYLNTF